MSRGLCGACGEWFDDVTPCKCGEYWQRVRIDPKTRALSVAPVITATIQLADDSRKIECPFCGKSWIGFKYNAEDPRKALSEQEVLTRVQAMGEESLSPDNFEGLMRALEALKTTRNVDGGRVDPGAELAALREQVKVLREALGKIAILSDEAVTLKIADEALEQTNPKDGE